MVEGGALDFSVQLTIDEDSPLRRPSSDQPYFDEAESLEVHEHVAMLLDEWSGGGLLRMLELNFSTFRLFAASALGAEPDYARRTANPRGRSASLIMLMSVEPLTLERISFF